MCQFFNFHPTFGRGDDANALGFAVQHDAQIEFALERLGHFHVDALNGLAFRAGLNGHQALAQQFAGGGIDLMVGLAQLDAAGLAAGSGVHLGLHRPVPAAQFRRRIDGLVGAVGHAAARHRHAEARQKLFRLVLVNVHASPSVVWKRVVVHR